MEKQEKPASAKKVERIAYISFGVLALFITVIIIIVKVQDKKFLNEGIRVEAIVNDLYESGTTKNRTHSMTISMFTRPSKSSNSKVDSSAKANRTSTIDNIIETISMDPNIGNYLRLTINCSSDSYQKYKPGDKITVVYLKEDSTDVRILSELE